MTTTNVGYSHAADPDAKPVIAVVFAGGVGTRMGDPLAGPKQFMSVGGKPILIYTLEHFQNHSRVGAIYLVSTEAHISEVKKTAEHYAITKLRTVVPGGSTAHESILCGLTAAVEDGNSHDTVVLIHDGVRPVINGDLIDRNIASTITHGNAITSIPAFETVARAWEGSAIVEEVADRHKMHVLQAPQTFRLGDVYKTNIMAREDGLIGKFVDQAHLMHHYGRRLHMVAGLRGNVKITVPLDFLFFTFLIESGQHERITQGGSHW